ncbi:hypothetical protein G7B40_001635 [Aetokthonos hydrillicola Thurmond2011]|jgi:uncharacterized protein YifN (PemK superfamily)|uniref:Uncharacterized protein n=1 Tax=Aetokthonos hydrillicola Thurmond2011 TaxID=2712845 RepID=A0AAP5I176_9CYAN|nr:hypothetical protein [Aetokthonos hydrillicola]MBO3462976.1 hypothetical protein [Aetokthonos hydrillicola CCALA 1050]MBW4591272.1 hypothetical protein [Aetokthonos hydrillicola CCALA 1050]MDR9893288.1 hypothetical protein [Aetokthonos hydrillicola Thurmond2011]
MVSIPDEVLAIQRINQDVQRRFPSLDDITLQAYVNEVVDAIARANIAVAAVLIDKVSPRRLDAIREEMKKLTVRIPTRVIISFLDGSVLECKFEKSKQAK